MAQQEVSGLSRWCSILLNMLDVFTSTILIVILVVAGIIERGLVGFGFILIAISLGFFMYWKNIIPILVLLRGFNVKKER